MNVAENSSGWSHERGRRQTTGPVGTTFKVTDTSAGPNEDSTAVYTVQAVRLLDPATPASSLDAPPAGKRLVGVEIKVTGVSGNEQDSADNDISATGSNGQVYTSALLGDGLTAGTDFNDGQFNTAPGTTEVGYVAFAVPNNVTIRSVSWLADSGMAGSPVTWTTSAG